jgi:two-component system cell cycle sensor histidine kinase/response regulator CckA
MQRDDRIDGGDEENTLTRMRAVRVDAELDAGTSAEKTLRFALEAAPITIWCVDVHGIFTLSEGRGLERMGRRGGELVGEDARALFGAVTMRGPDGETRSGRDVLEHALQGEMYEGVADVGSGMFDTRVMPLRDPNGTVVGVLGVGTDVTPFVQTEAALRASQSAFRALIESFPDFVIVHRGDTITYASPSTARGLGWDSAEQLIGHSMSALFVSEELAPSSIALPSAARARELGLRRRDGEVLFVEVLTVDVVWEGEPASAVVARDVSERRRVQAHLLQTDRLVALGSLAGGVAHEIANPLTYVITNLELVSAAIAAAAEQLRKEGPLAANTVRDRLEALLAPLRSAADGAARVRGIAKDLRTFSRSESESRQLLDVRSVLEPAVHLAMNDIRQRARFERALGDVPLVHAHESRLGQVFLNLLLNAAHAIPEGRPAENVVRVSTATDAEGRAVVEVLDSGRGIAPENVSRIFDPFFTTKPTGAGTGLGLSICLATVSALGGTIDVSPAPGGGTRFRVTLPPARLERRPRPTRRPPPPVESRRHRVLIVDDEPALLDSLRSLLEGLYDVVTAGSCNDAIARLTEQPLFDAVLCDVLMPDRTGKDLYEHVATTQPELLRRFVFMSGGAFTDETRRFIERVPNLRLDKPFGLRELTEAIDVAARAEARPES